MRLLVRFRSRNSSEEVEHLRNREAKEPEACRQGMGV